MPQNIPINEDRKRLVYWKKLLGKKAKKIAVKCHISKSSVNNIKKLYNTYGVLTNPFKEKRGPKSKKTC
jgi:transposase